MFYEVKATIVMVAVTKWVTVALHLESVQVIQQNSGIISVEIKFFISFFAYHFIENKERGKL